MIAAQAARRLGVVVESCEPLGGGDLSSVWRLRLADGRAIVAKPGPAADAEAEMLRAIAATGAPAPAVFAADDDLLLMTGCAADGRLGGEAWGDLAATLVRLHHPTACRTYGWHRDHRFGPVAIANHCDEEWPRFWAEKRLLCHLPHIAPALGRRIERLAAGLPDRLPRHPPAVLLHGDLWGGNILVARRGGVATISALIDPACYHGDREVDVAMLGLFDAPLPRFLDALDLAPGWRAREPVYRLWPLLVHLRLFGDGYAGAVRAALDLLGV